jgi:hypothetical protein
MLAYSVWTVVWLAYNVFIICYYLDVGDLDKKEDILRKDDVRHQLVLPVKTILVYVVVT